MTGQRFGRLVVLERTDDYILDSGKRKTMWRCFCECGNIVVVRGESLKRGITLSCGCYKSERVRDAHVSKVIPNNFLIDGKIVKVILPNTGNEMICELEDWEKLKDRKWFETEKGYAKTRITKKGKKKIYSFHREIVGAKENEILDHINQNRLDNRRENLRIETLSMNCFNRKCKNESGYNGVTKYKDGKWKANIVINYKNIYLGIFDDLESAINARKKAEIKYRGELSKKE